MARENIDSPKNMRPSATPYRPPTSSPSRQVSKECAWPGAVQREVGLACMSSPSQVPPPSSRGPAQPASTSRNAVSMRTS